ncbi:MAG: sugar transferase [Gemmatimonadaceae bacterium]|nr:sugar transferase [Gemmatimonadaceae bacterium]
MTAAVQVEAARSRWDAMWPRDVLQQLARTNRRQHALREWIRGAMLHLLDVAAVAGAVTVLALLDDSGIWPRALAWINPSLDLLSVGVQLSLALLVGLHVCGAYRSHRSPTAVWPTLGGVGLGVSLFHWPFLWQAIDGSSAAYLRVVVVVAVFVSLGRIAARALVRAHVLGRLGLPRALYIGTPEDIADALHRTPLHGDQALLPVAQVTTGPLARGRPREHAPLELRLPCLLNAHDVDTVVLCSQFASTELQLLLGIAETSGCRVVSPSRMYPVARQLPRVAECGGFPLVELTRPAARAHHLAIKRFIDLAGAMLLVILASPIMLVVAVLVRLTSRGPILFRQERVGYGGTSFRILKFRTMRDGAEGEVECLRQESVYRDRRLFKVRADPRTTPLGRVLRRTSLDELPQLLNVIEGSMSLVGPRPPLPCEVAAYEHRAFLRFDVKPGITGPWQVAGRNRITSFDEVVALEAEYMNGWTIWRDLRILLRTVPVVLRMDGAY